MAVKIKEESSVEERTRTISLQVEAADYRRHFQPSQTIRPELLRITLKKRGDDAWAHDKTVLTGPRVLTNGHLGTPLTETFYFGFEIAPDWVEPLVEERLKNINSELVT